MIDAISVDFKGNPTGIRKIFTEQQWNILTRTYGKRLRWKSLEIIKEEPEISEEKLEEIFKEPIFEERLKELTKKELITEYGLPEDFIKKSKDDIIEEILK